MAAERAAADARAAYGEEGELHPDDEEEAAEAAVEAADRARLRAEEVRRFWRRSYM